MPVTAYGALNTTVYPLYTTYACAATIPGQSKTLDRACTVGVITLTLLLFTSFISQVPFSTTSTSCLRSIDQRHSDIDMVSIKIYVDPLGLLDDDHGNLNKW